MGMIGVTRPLASKDFPLVYEELLYGLLNHGALETNERTGRSVRVGMPMSFTLDLGSHKLPVAGCRRLYPQSAAAETAWYVQGTQDPAFIMQYAPSMWGKFIEPIWNDGSETSQPTGKFDGVKASYGHRWRRKFKRDQLSLAVEALRRNPSDRRAYVSAWDPSEDGLGSPGLNVPCPLGFTLSITSGRLNSSLFVRSSDVFMGLPYDVMGHCLLVSVLAYTLGVEPGCVQFCLAHPHLYDVHEEMAEAALRQDFVSEQPQMPFGWSLTHVEVNPHLYVDQVRMLASEVRWPAYSPRPEVVA